MPNINSMKESKFLKKDECNPPILVTIESVHQMNVAASGAPEEMKWCVQFAEHEKPMVLNSTNAQLIAKITGSEETENWGGKKIVLYDDPSVSYAGKVTGGIRCRAPKNKPAAAPAPAPQPVAKPAPEVEEEDSTPF